MARRGRTYELQALGIIIPLHGISWSVEQPFAISLPLTCYLLSHLPQNSERPAERSLYHPCILRKLYGTLEAAAAARAEASHCAISSLLSAIRSDHTVPNPFQSLSPVWPSQWSRRLQKEAQQETPIAANRFKWFNTYLVPEVGH